MRAIDADALVSAIDKYSFYHENDRDMVGEIIRVQPTIDPKRRTGHWKYSSSPTAECDQCGHIYPGFLRFDNYCPHCGSFNAEKGDE